MEYSSLKEYTKKMKQIADECVRCALKNQDNNLYQINITNLKKEFGKDFIDGRLLLDMLSEREEISVKNHFGGKITLEVMPGFIVEEDDDNILQVISQDELQVKLARHCLWLLGEYGGEQADLSNLYIEKFNFEGKELCSAVLNGAKFVNCSFKNTSMGFSECKETKFIDCNMTGITAEESNFYGAEFRDCTMNKGVYTHSNFHNAKFFQNDIAGVSFQNACIVDAEWIDTDTTTADMQNVSTHFDDWDQNAIVPALEM